MSVFGVEPIKLSKEAETLQSITSILNNNKESLERIRHPLYYRDPQEVALKVV